MAHSLFTIIGIAKEEFYKPTNKSYSVLKVESTYYRNNSKATTLIPCLVYNNNFKVNTDKSIKGKVVAVNGYISSYSNPNSPSDIPSVSLVVSEMEIYGLGNSESDSKEPNTEDIDSYDDDEENTPIREINDDDLPF